MTVGDNIKRIRLEKGLTQKQLGEKCNIAESTIRKYELGLLNPKRQTIKKIAEGLGVFDHQLNPEMIVTFDNGKLFDQIWKVVKRELEDESPFNIDERVTRMGDLFDQLNEKGQEKAIEQVEMLTKIEEYKK